YNSYAVRRDAIDRVPGYLDAKRSLYATVEKRAKENAKNAAPAADPMLTYSVSRAAALDASARAGVEIEMAQGNLTISENPFDPLIEIYELGLFPAGVLEGFSGGSKFVVWHPPVKK